MAKLDPQALSAAELAKLLTAAGERKVTAAEIKAQLKIGAPSNKGGTFNLIHFAAWLASRVP